MSTIRAPESTVTYPSRRRPNAILTVLPALAALALIATPARARGKVERIIEGDPVIRVLPKDAIPAIDDPKMIPATEADNVMKDDEPVLGVFHGKTARAYPTWFLDGHEIVNDRLGELPIAATW